MNPYLVKNLSPDQNKHAPCQTLQAFDFVDLFTNLDQKGYTNVKGTDICRGSVSVLQSLLQLFKSCFVGFAELIGVNARHHGRCGFTIPCI